jgi:hypothetical protein
MFIVAIVISKRLGRKKIQRKKGYVSLIVVQARVVNGKAFMTRIAVFRPCRRANMEFFGNRRRIRVTVVQFLDSLTSALPMSSVP